MSKVPLTNDEKETLISFDETSNDATIMTYNKRWQTHLENRLGLKPVRDDGYGGKEYRIAKSRIPLPRVPRVLSPDAKRKLAERLARGRDKKHLVSGRAL